MNVEKSLTAKGEYLFQNGKFIGERVYYNYRALLYVIENETKDEFYEVFYHPVSNQIDRIEMVKDMEIIDLYIKSNQK